MHNLTFLPTNFLIVLSICFSSIDNKLIYFKNTLLYHHFCYPLPFFMTVSTCFRKVVNFFLHNKFHALALHSADSVFLSFVFLSQQTSYLAYVPCSSEKFILAARVNYTNTRIHYRCLLTINKTPIRTMQRKINSRK